MASRIHIIAIGLPALLVNAALAQPAVPRPVDESAPVVPAAQGTDAPADTPIKLPHRLPSIWNDAVGDPAIPVFDAAIHHQRGWIVLLGGFRSDLETTNIIQIHHPDRGWLPIGSQLLESRAGHTITPLSDGRVLIAGGMQGSLGGAITALASCEVLDPLTAGSRAVEPLKEPLLGHTAHALPGGRAIVIGGSTAHIFDGDTMQWTHHVSLHRARRDHASVLVDHRLLMIIGGDDEGTIEMIDLASDEPVSELWSATLPVPVSRSSAVALPDGPIFVVGGIDPATRMSVGDAWFIDPAERTIETGPDLVIEGGVAKPAVALDDGRVVVVGGEHVAPGVRAAADVSRLYDPLQRRVWELAPLPESGSRRHWYRDLNNRIAFLGGYRFIDAETARREDRRGGPHLSGNGYSVRVGGFGPMTD